MFLYIDPLKQGLKHIINNCLSLVIILFLYIDPLKQGLKQTFFSNSFHTHLRFLYIDPLKQGLKQPDVIPQVLNDLVFIHRSNKTRIETFEIVH